jgi:hypothetical protein
MSCAPISGLARDRSFMRASRVNRLAIREAALAREHFQPSRASWTPHVMMPCPDPIQLPAKPGVTANKPGRETAPGFFMRAAQASSVVRTRRSAALRPASAHPFKARVETFAKVEGRAASRIHHRGADSAGRAPLCLVDQHECGDMQCTKPVQYCRTRTPSGVRST